MSNEHELVAKSERRKEDYRKRKEKLAPDDRNESGRDMSTETTAPEGLDKNLSNPSQKREKRHKRKHHKLLPDHEDEKATDGEALKKRKKKRKDYNPDTTIHNVEGSEKLKPEKLKKRRPKCEEVASQENAATGSKLSSKENKKKPKKDRTKDDAASSLPDPAGDTTLTEKARGALLYAYIRLTSPGSWKFNKAHQNWIVKHFFSSDSIPEDYVGVVVGYLSGCQGGVRQNLAQACNEQLELLSSNDGPVAPPLPPSDSNALAGQSQAAANSKVAETGNLPEEVRKILEARARTLLKILETPSS